MTTLGFVKQFRQGIREQSMLGRNNVETVKKAKYSENVIYHCAQWKKKDLLEGALWRRY